MNEITAVCQECGKQFEYVLKPGFPRKYCFECSEKKKAAYEDMEKPIEVVKPGEKPTQKPSNGHQSMYVSYAKDVFVAMLHKMYDDKPIEEGAIMYRAIELVKQAKEAFD